MGTNAFKEATLTASVEGHTVAKLGIVALKPRVRTVLVVQINNSSPYEVDYRNLNQIYQQCAIQFIPFSTNVYSTYSNIPTNNKWTTRDLLRLYLYLSERSEIQDIVRATDHLIIIIDGTDSESSSILGRGHNASSCIWVYNRNTEYDIIPHEIGHTCGLEDEYIYRLGSPPIRAKDKDNVMNLMAPDLFNSMLRYHQWKTIQQTLETQNEN